MMLVMASKLIVASSSPVLNVKEKTSPFKVLLSFEPASALQSSMNLES